MNKRLMRSGRDQKIAGVCAGVAHYLDIGSYYRSRNMGCPCFAVTELEL